nr:uncharacterized protein LOC111774207 [Equus caballus]
MASGPTGLFSGFRAAQRVMQNWVDESAFLWDESKVSLCLAGALSPRKGKNCARRKDGRSGQREGTLFRPASVCFCGLILPAAASVTRDAGGAGGCRESWGWGRSPRSDTQPPTHAGPPDWGGRRQAPAHCPRRAGHLEAGHLEAGGVDSDHSENSLKPGSLLLRIRALGRGSEAPSDSPGSGNPKTETSVTQTPFSKPRIPLHHSWRRSEELSKEAPGFLVDGRVIYKGFSSDRNRNTTSFRD